MSDLEFPLEDEDNFKEAATAHSQAQKNTGGAGRDRTAKRVENKASY
jgi:hypothetical protein